MDLLGAILGHFQVFLGFFFTLFFFWTIGLAPKTPSRLHIPSGEVLGSFLGIPHFFFFFPRFAHVMPESGQTGLFLIDFWLLWSVQLFSFRHSFSKVLSDLREREFWIGRSRYERIESRPSLLLLHYYFSPSVYICRFLGSY